MSLPAVSAFATALSRWLNWYACSEVVLVIQIQGSLLLSIAAVGWLLSARSRQAELKRQLAWQAAAQPSASRASSNGHATSVKPSAGGSGGDGRLGQPHLNGASNGRDSTCGANRGHLGHPGDLRSQSQAVGPNGNGPAPGVTVVLPVKGCRPFAEDNWRSQLELQYPGRLEFLFVTHSCDDISFHTIDKLLAKLRPGLGNNVTARVLASGCTTTCSQKIHNLCRGVTEADAASKYVLCIDDDVQLHRNTLQDLVGRLESDPSLFLATGVPFDVPAPGSGLLTYCMLVYHLPILIAFSVRDITFNVWGGCVLMPLRHLRNDTYGIMRAWRDGGYSDDLTVAAKCNQHGLRIACPASAIFVQNLEPRVTWAKFWNYLRRQTYVLDTYSDKYNRLMNWSLMAFSAYANLFVWATMVLALLRFATGVAFFAILPVLIAFSPDGLSTKATTMEFLFGTSCPAASATSVAAWLTMAAGYLSCRRLCSTVIELLNSLSPNREPLQPNAISQPMVWAALLVQCLLQPVCVAATLLMREIEWSGIKYWKRCGRITHIQSAGDRIRACPKISVNSNK